MKNPLLRAGSAALRAAYYKSIPSPAPSPPRTTPSSPSSPSTPSTPSSPAYPSPSTMSSGLLSSASRLWRRFNQQTYAGDFLGLIILALANASLFVVEPFHRMFSIDDPRLQFPHAEHEHVPVPLLLVLSIGVPSIAITAWTGVCTKGKHFLQVSLLGLGNSLLLSSFVTDFIKQGVGRPRPDLIARCQPREDTPHHQLVTFTVCYQTNHHTLHDGFRSFPSGHSSTAFSGLLYLSLFLAGQFFVFRPGSDLARTAIAFSATFLALFIAISRLEDYRHDYADVAVGSWIGIFCAIFSYRRYFPSLWSVRCNEPYKIPLEGDGYEGLKEDDDDAGEGPRRRLSDIEMGMVRGS
ncbi:hypothetical protein H072_4626 [Dactylellina haptotyla CBS 200.50]|uniref:Phosphatidic acid phosphatase type 2/haloperoxidase domain-containing protein n=1 Tax=Dactylellina haptotyla (strain CBS 200.50) TaxID=1284197 RepID=S8BPV0_DACHA|nr:hypothetical protein H072_4626 [Dactylellina haptotyla CBS 200.50]